MKKATLGVRCRVAAIGLAGALMGCASSDGGLESPLSLASQTAGPRERLLAAEPAPKDFLALANENAGTTRDPSEARNRATLEFNQELNRSVVYPAAKAYRDGVPEPVRDSVESFANNLGEPLVFANDVLQLRSEAAATTLARFAMNSTFGLGGLFDVASREKLPRQTGDFGQTLYVWGVRDSEYLVLPVVGPTTTRDLIGSTVEFAALTPINWLAPVRLAEAAREFGVAGSTATTLTTGVNISGSTAGALAKVDKAGDLQTLEASSIDFYVMLESVVTQKREAELREALAQSGWTTTFSNGRTMETASWNTFQTPAPGGAGKAEPASHSALQ
jgi:phospholipid-binding lipoprotein MlaA